jgi:hypothetical protein
MKQMYAVAVIELNGFEIDLKIIKADTKIAALMHHSVIDKLIFQHRKENEVEYNSSVSARDINNILGSFGCIFAIQKILL